MSVEQESQADLSVDTNSAEHIVGGSGKGHKSKHAATHVLASTPSVTVASSSAGLDLGPDPAYPNPSGDNDTC